MGEYGNAGLRDERTEVFGGLRDQVIGGFVDDWIEDWAMGDSGVGGIWRFEDLGDWGIGDWGIWGFGNWGFGDGDNWGIRYMGSMGDW